ncbi:hypothetical protein FLV_17720 [Flavobacterium pectinovorum]|nr:hypothetical protein [Flavobacterium pectinovorum]MCI9846626.1 hypothetical protein [Flavobacterium pectinovorum]
MINPDCGLKTRHRDETKKALIEMVAAALEMRAEVEYPVSLQYFSDNFCFLMPAGEIENLVVMICFNFV